VVNGVLGGIQLKSQRVIAARLLRVEAGHAERRAGGRSHARSPRPGVIQAAQTNWYLKGGDLASTMAAGIGVLERGVGADPAAGSAGSGSAW
jgi:hypothetical protein